MANLDGHDEGVIIRHHKITPARQRVHITDLPYFFLYVVMWLGWCSLSFIAVFLRIGNPVPAVITAFCVGTFMAGILEFLLFVSLADSINQPMEEIIETLHAPLPEIVEDPPAIESVVIRYQGGPVAVLKQLEPGAVAKMFQAVLSTNNKRIFSQNLARDYGVYFVDFEVDVIQSLRGIRWVQSTRKGNGWEPTQRFKRDAPVWLSDTGRVLPPLAD